MNSSPKRTLHLEDLENRMMLSAVSLTSFQPSGTQAAYWTGTVTLSADQTHQMDFAVEAGQQLSYTILNSNPSGNTTLSFSGSTSNFNGSKTGTLTATGTSSPFSLTSFSGGTYTIYIASNSAMESELIQNTNTNNTASGAQSLTLKTISLSSSVLPANTQIRQTAVLGSLGISDTSDFYTFTSNGGKAGIQLYSMSGAPLNFEVLDSNQKVLASSTSVNEYSSVLNSLSLSSGKTYFIRVASPDGTYFSSSDYTLTVTENCNASLDNTEPNSFVNVLDSTGVGIGRVENGASNISDVNYLIEDGGIIADVSVDGNRMATVSYTKDSDGSISSVTFRFWENIQSEWKEIITSVHTESNNPLNLDFEKDFECSVSICGEDILVGLPQSNALWQLVADGDAFNYYDRSITDIPASAAFGKEVCLTEDYVFVAAPGSETDGSYFCIFDRTVDWGYRILSLTKASQFGKAIVYDEENALLGFSDSVSNTLYFFMNTPSGPVQISGLGLNGESIVSHLYPGRTVTEFGSAMVMENGTLAVSCTLDNSEKYVLIFTLNAETSSWNTSVSILSVPENGELTASNFGSALALSGNFLAVSSSAAFDADGENQGIVYLYQKETTDEGTRWVLTQTFQGDEGGALGTQIFLEANRLDVQNGLLNQISTFSNFTSLDQWALNVTDTEQISIVLSTRTTSMTLPTLKIMAPDGTFVSVEPVISQNTATYTFSPTSIGTYLIEINGNSDPASSAVSDYVLSVTSGTYGSVLDTISVETHPDNSRYLVVELAQQILVSDLTGAAASLGNVSLNFVEVLDGNKIVWEVPESTINGTYQLTVSGLTSASGEAIPQFQMNYQYSGIRVLEMEKVGTVGSNIRLGSTEKTLQANESWKVAISCSELEKENLKYTFTGTVNVEESYDAEQQTLFLNITNTLASSQTVTLEVILNAVWDGSSVEFNQTFSGFDSIEEGGVLGTVSAFGTKEIAVSLEASEFANFALNDSAGNSLTFELYQKNADGTRTRIAIGSERGSTANGQRITGLENTTASTANYVLKITNTTSETVDFALAAIKNAMWESESNDISVELTETMVIGDVSLKSEILLESVDTPALSTEQLSTLGRKTVISGNYAAVMGSDFAVIYHLENGFWEQVQVLTAPETSDSANVIWDLALDGETFVLTLNGEVQIYTLDVASQTLKFDRILEIPESIASQTNTFFGYSIDVCGDTLAVSAPKAADANGYYPECGSVFLYTKNAQDGTWEFSRELVSSGRYALMKMGVKLSLSENTLAIQALSNSLTGTSTLSIWMKSNDSWSESALLDTKAGASFFTNADLQAVDGEVFISSPSLGKIYDYVYTQNEDNSWSWLNYEIVPNFYVTAFAVDETASNLRIAGIAQTENQNAFFLCDYRYQSTEWEPVVLTQTSSYANSMALGETALLAFAPSIAGGSASLAQSEKLSDMDIYAFTAVSASPSFMLRNENGTDILNTLIILDSEGNAVNVNQSLTVGERYFAVVSPTALDETQRYFLGIGSAQTQPKAECFLASENAALGNVKITNGSFQNAKISKVTVRFSESVDVSQLSAYSLSAVSASGTQMKSNSYSIKDGNCVEFTFSQPLADGTWTIQASSLASISGESFLWDGNSSLTFTVDTEAPQVKNAALDLTSSPGKGILTVEFSEEIASLEFKAVGLVNGTLPVLSRNLKGKTLTLTFDLSSCTPDILTFSLDSILDEAGNATEDFTLSFGFTGTSTETVEISDAMWSRNILDGTFAYSVKILGYVESGASMSFKLNLQEGEQIAFRYPNGQNGAVAAWDAETGIVTVSADGTGTVGTKNGASFEIEILRNTNAESTSAEMTELTFTKIADLNGVSIQQTSAFGNLSSAAEVDEYRFTAASESTISAAVTGAGNEFVLALYEVVENGSGESLVLLAESSGSSDSMDAWISGVLNTSVNEKTYVLKVALADPSAGFHSDLMNGKYQLVVTANALFNGSISSSMENALSLDKMNSAVGHVSREASTLLASLARDAESGYSIASNDRFLFVGVPGNSDEQNYGGKVLVYEFNGISYQQISVLTAGAAAENAQFGAGIAVDGNTIAVAAPNEQNVIEQNGESVTVYGAIYIYSIGEDGSLTQVQKILNPFTSTDFGCVMDLSGQNLVVGTQEEAQPVCLFSWDDSGVQQQNLSNELLGNFNQMSWPYLGYSVAIDGNQIIIGAPSAKKCIINGSASEMNGMAFILMLTDSGEISETHCLIADEASHNTVGYAVTIENGMAVVAGVSGKDIVLHCSDLNYTGNYSTFTLPGMAEDVSLLSFKSLNFQDGILSVAGNSAESFTVAHLKQLNGEWNVLNTHEVAKEAENFSIANVCLGFESAWLGSTFFTSDPYAALSSLKASGMIYAFDQQQDFYRFTAADSTVSVSVSTQLSLAAQNFDSEALTLSLLDANGKVLDSASVTNGTVTFKNLRTKQDYFLSVSAADGMAFDYAVSLAGIVQPDKEIDLQSAQLTFADGTNAALNLAGGVTNLSAKPQSLTLSFDEALAEERISVESIRISVVGQTFNATGFTMASDMKSVTFQFDSTMSYPTENVQILINTNSFYATSGKSFELENADEDGIAALSCKLASVSISHKLKLDEDSNTRFLTWQFGGALEVDGWSQDDWENAVSIMHTPVGGTAAEINSKGTFSYDAQTCTLTWTDTAGLLKLDDSVSTKLNSAKVQTVSSLPFAGLQQDGENWILAKTFKVSNSSAEAQIVVRAESSISEEGSLTAENVPASEKWVHEWNAVWVEVWGAVLSSSESGIQTFTAEIAYDSTLFQPQMDEGEVQNVRFDSSLFSSVTVTKKAEEDVLVISAQAAENVLAGACDSDGAGTRALIASIRLQPGTEGVEYTAEGGKIVSSEIGIQFVDASIKVVDSNEADVTGSVEDVTAALPAVYPVVYDLNDSKSVEVNDLIIFAKNFGKAATYSETTFLCDFNASGSVDINDLIDFAKNFGKSYSSRTSVTLSSKLTANWGNEELPSTSGVNVTELAEMSVAEAGLISETVDALEEDAELSMAYVSQTAEIAEDSALTDSTLAVSDTLQEQVSSLTQFSFTLTTQDSEIVQEMPKALYMKLPQKIAFSGMIGSAAWRDWSVLLPAARREAQIAEEARAAALTETSEGLWSSESGLDLQFQPNAESLTEWSFGDLSQDELTADIQQEILEDLLKQKQV